jgi:hypothetical protein
MKSLMKVQKVYYSLQIHNTIAHEVFHAVMKITEDRDINDEEAQAWLVGHISGDIYKFLKRKKIEIING